MVAAGWSSLEITKLVVAAATPVVVLLFGVVVNRAGRRVEQAQWTNRKLVERRLELYGEMAGALNDLYCFFSLVGHFREIEPPAAVALKRTLDKLFYVNEFLMGEEFGERYRDFMSACFEIYTGFGQDAKLRADIGAQRSERREWDEAWAPCFVSQAGSVTRLAVVGDRYRALMHAFADAIGVRDAAPA
jgi:hypothetical protein